MIKYFVAAFIIYFFSSTLQAQEIDFMTEGRLASSVVYKGWEEVQKFIYRPSLSLIQSMVYFSARETFGANFNFQIFLNDLQWQYVIYDGNFIGGVIQVSINWEQKQGICFIYSRFYINSNNWFLNNYSCTEIAYEADGERSKF